MKRIARSFRLSAIALLLMLPMIAVAQQPAAQPSDKQQSSKQQSDKKPFTKEQLDQMTAQIALYPDALLSQVLMASTYPDEFMEASKWSKEHSKEKGDEAVKKVQDKNWDPSVASLVAFPEVLITLGQKPDYVKNLGDAFLAQPDEVMDSIQRLRAQAKKAGNLKSDEQVKVSTKQVESTPAPSATTTQPTTSQVIVIEPTQPSVVYVPAYNPAVVYGAWAYPAYPPVYVPPPPGYWFTAAVGRGIAWGIGIGVSNAIWGNCNWGHHNVDINVNRYNNINTNRHIDANTNRTSWNHNPEHRREAYRGGDATRQRLDRQYQSGNREQYRGRDASRARAEQTMENRGVNVDQSARRDRAEGAARDRAQNIDRGAAQERAQNVDRDAARQRVENADRGAARERAQSASRDNAFRGADSPHAGAQGSRGASSHRAAGGGGGFGGGGGRGGGGRGGRR